jgi:uncharacterized membrane protein YraQ (UPF0718 family)
MDWGDLYYRFLNSYTKQVIDEIISLVIQLLPYVIIGTFVTVFIKRYTSAETFKKFISDKNIIISVIIASLLGIISPLGSYVVIPLSAALVMAGLPLAPVIAFAVSSPMINPNLIILTAGALGIEMAVMRCVSTFILGISAGLITQLFIKSNNIGIRASKSSTINKVNGSKSLNNPNINDASKLIVRRPFWAETWQHTKYISKHFSVGIIVAALTKVLIPVTLVSDYLGSEHVFSVFLATLAGVPFYTCGGAAIPVVQQLAELGADKGAILAFFISGPGTKIANIAVMVSVFKKGVVYIYFLVSLIGALVMGLIYHYF